MTFEHQPIDDDDDDSSSCRNFSSNSHRNDMRAVNTSNVWGIAYKTVRLPNVAPRGPGHAEIRTFADNPKRSPSCEYPLVSNISFDLEYQSLFPGSAQLVQWL